MTRGFQKTAWLCLLQSLILCVTAVGFQDVKFKTLKPGGAEFAVEIPGEPSRILVYVPLGSLAVQVRAWHVVKNNTRYQIVSFPKSSVGPLSPDADFELFSESFQRIFAKTPNSSSFDRKIVSNGETSLQYQIRIGEHPGVLRLYNAPKNFYAVFVIGSGESDVSVSRFLASFKLSNRREAGVESLAEMKPDTLTPPSPWANLNFRDVDTIVIGILNGKAVALPIPKYPRGATGTGNILVRVLADERGVVTSAVPVAGPSQFYEAATGAALKAHFKPVSFMGRGVKVSGILIYAFKEGG